MPQRTRLNTTQPVNWRHPLNRGLVSWWLPTAGRTGTNTLFDIAGTNHGTLTNGPTWESGPSAVSRPVRLNASGKGAEVTASAAVKLSLPMTVSRVMRSLGAPGAYSSIFGVTANNSDTAPYTGPMLNWSSAGTVVRLVSNNAGTSYEDDTAVGYASLSGWSHLVAVFTATGNSLYVNGALSYSNSTSRGSPTYGATALLAAGNYTGVSRNPNIDFGGGAIHDRALSASEVAALYDQSRRDYPDLLRRVSTATWFVGGGSTSVSGTLTATASATTSLVGTAAASGGLAATCSATTSLDGRAAIAGEIAASGSATTSLVGAATATGVLSSTGSATTSLAAAAGAAGVLSATGSAATSLVGAAAISGVLSATCAATTSLAGQAAISATVTATAAATTSLAGAATAAGVLTSTCSATTSFVGQSSSSGQGVLSATCSATTSLVGVAAVSGGLAATGSATTSLAGRATVTATATATCSATTSLAGAALAAGGLSAVASATTAVTGAALASAALTATCSVTTSLVGAGGGTTTDYEPHLFMAI